MGRRLLKVELQRFDRACAFAQRFRDLCRGTGFDFNKKYLVVENYRHDRVIDYDEIAVQLEIAPFDEYPPYPDGGRVGDMVYFDCCIHADSRATHSYRSKYLNAEKTSMQITLGDGWEFDGITLDFTMRCISIDGQHSCTGPSEWDLMCHSEPNRGFLQTLESGFTELRDKYLDNEGYKLRSLSAEEAVVDFVVELCLDGLVLGVVLLKVEQELLFNFLCIDGSRDRDGGNLAGDDTLRGGQTKKGTDSVPL